jgi:hypothetical protein
MSAGFERRRAAGTTVDSPPGEVVVSDDGERVRAVWHPTRGRTFTALFRVATDDGVAVLQHVRRLTHGTDTGVGCQLDASVGLDDVPRCRLATMRDLGLTPAEEPPTDRAGLEAFV